MSKKDTEKKIFGASIEKEVEGYKLTYKPLPYVKWLDYGPAWEDKGIGWAGEIAHLCLVGLEGPGVPEFDPVLQQIGGIRRACVPAEVIYSLPQKIQAAMFFHLYEINRADGEEQGNSSAP